MTDQLLTRGIYRVAHFLSKYCAQRLTSGPLCQEVGAQSDTQRSHLRRVRCGGALQKCIEDPLSEVLIQGTINTQPAFIEVFLEYTKLYYRSLDSREARPCRCTRTRACKFNWQRRSQSKVTNSTRRLGVW